jgi:hypothetical protein
MRPSPSNNARDTLSHTRDPVGVDQWDPIGGRHQVSEPIKQI